MLLKEREISMKNAIDKIDSCDFLHFNHLYAFSVYHSNRKGKLGQTSPRGHHGEDLVDNRATEIKSKIKQVWEIYIGDSLNNIRYIIYFNDLTENNNLILSSAMK